MATAKRITDLKHGDYKGALAYAREKMLAKKFVEPMGEMLVMLQNGNRQDDFANALIKLEEEVEAKLEGK